MPKTANIYTNALLYSFQVINQFNNLTQNFKHTFYILLNRSASPLLHFLSFQPFSGSTPSLLSSSSISSISILLLSILYPSPLLLTFLFLSIRSFLLLALYSALLTNTPYTSRYGRVNQYLGLFHFYSLYIRAKNINICFHSRVYSLINFSSIYGYNGQYHIWCFSI